MAENSDITVPNTKNRPLSPHLSIYKLPLTTAIMSITHRITGVVLTVGLIVLVAWLWALAYCDDTMAWWQTYQQAWWFIAALVGWTLAFFYHFMNGIRHLGWDSGSGFSLDATHRSGWIVLVGTVLLSGLVWYPILAPLLIGQ